MTPTNLVGAEIMNICRLFIFDDVRDGTLEIIAVQSRNEIFALFSELE